MKKDYDMINRVKVFCRQSELLHQGDRVLLGLSGGADSVCLFLILLSLAEEWNLTVVPVHVNHNIRGEEAEQDQKFCEELCRRHQLELHSVSVQVRELAEQNGWTLEEAGRNARYRVFSEYMELYQCNRIAVAHHKNDQAETVLFQLLRGSRLKGLSGMQPQNGCIIRPLLCVTREEIEQYLLELCQDYCIDRTNFEEEYTRNVIRHRILPAAQEIQQKAVEHISETAKYLGRLEEYLERLTREIYQRAVTEKEQPWGCSLLVPILKEAEPLLAERVVYLALCRVTGGKKDISAGYVTDCMDLLEKQTGKQIRLPGGLIAKKSYDVLWLGREVQEAEEYFVEISTFPFETELPGNQGTLHLKLLTPEEQPELYEEKIRSIPKSTYTKWFDYDRINNGVILKTPAAEDMIALYTDGRGKRVLDVLAEAKIPKEERSSRWILADRNQVLWIPGIRGSEAFRVTDETKRILIATIDGGK